MEPKWIKNCTICNSGLCMRVEELKDQGHSEKSAFKAMNKEAALEYPELKDEYSSQRISNRYRYYMKKRGCQIDTPPELGQDSTSDQPTEVNYDDIKEPPDKARVSDSFNDAFEVFYEQVRKARVSKWKDTSKKAALEHVEMIKSLIISN